MGTLQVSLRVIFHSSIQVLSKNLVFELFLLVVDNLRHTIINYYHIMKITGNFYRLFFYREAERVYPRIGPQEDSSRSFARFWG